MKWLKQLFVFLIQLVIIAILPFWVFIRGSVWLYEAYGVYHWLGLAAMFGLVFFILLIYMAMVWDAVFGANKITRRSLKGKMLLVFLLLGVYAGYGLFNLSGGNAKTEEVRKEYTSLHPFMRMAVGTFVLFDKSILVTDMARGQEDYKKMGLKTIKNSLHYEQKTGYVHAMDLRTKGHSEFRNTMLKWYFKVLGFNTLRHVGTADHLHISLTVRGKPGVI
ncbi:MAG: hypothetical protein AAFR61_31545 [Bacteroidota bacterium]